MQKTFMKSLLKKASLFPAFFFLFWAIFPLAWNRPFDLYIMVSLFNWLCFILSLFGAILLEMLMAYPDLRKNLTHFERGITQKKKTTAEAKPQKEEELPIF
jgi:hypothetical protein